MEAFFHLTYGGYEAWIEVDGKKLQCYSTEVDPAKKIVTCWIASEVGKTFSIGFQPADSKLSSRVRAYLDGTRIKSTWWDKEETKCCRYFCTLSTSDTMEAPFMFSMLELTDDDDYLEASLTADVGEIKLVFDSITDPVWTKRPKSKKSSTCTQRTLPTVEKVHERSKKGMTHRIGIGNEQLKTKQKSKSNQVANYTRQAHLVTLIFRYRPLDLLQANGIIPHAPKLVMPSQDKDLSTSRRKRKATYLKEDVQEGVKSFEDRENALLAEPGRLKDEKERFLLAELEKLRKDKHSTSENAPRKKVKQETKPLFFSGEVIDLT